VNIKSTDGKVVATGAAGCLAVVIYFGLVVGFLCLVAYLLSHIIAGAFQ